MTVYQRYLRQAVLMLIAVCLVAGLAFSQELPRLSPNASVYQQIGLTDVTIKYSRPGVKGRVIWGGLVPYNKIWRTGANKATTISISDDVEINGQALPAGTYSVATIPTENEWTVIFNKKAELWGAFEYDQAFDALRIQVKPQPAPFLERMMFYFDNLTDNAADAVLWWEKLKVPFTIKVDVQKKALENARKAMAEFKGDRWQTPYRCANYAYNQGVALDEALSWVEKSLAVEENYFNTSLKARLLAKTGNTKEAVKVGEKALKLGKAMKNPPGNIAEMEKLVREWKKTM